MHSSVSNRRRADGDRRAERDGEKCANFFHDAATRAELKSCDLKRRFEYHHLSPCAPKIHKCENDGWAGGCERAITANQHAYLIARAKYKLQN